MIYEIDCPKCDEEVVFTSSAVSGPEVICHCGAVAKKKVSMPMFKMTNVASTVPDNMYVREPGVDKDIANRRKELDAKNDAALREIVVEEVRSAAW